MMNLFLVGLITLSGFAYADTCNVCVSGSMLRELPLIAKTFGHYGYTIDKKSSDRAYCTNTKNADFSMQFEWIECSGIHCGYSVYNNATGKAFIQAKKGLSGEYEQIIEGHRADQLVRHALALSKKPGSDLNCHPGESASDSLSKEMSPGSATGTATTPKTTEVKSQQP